MKSIISAALENSFSYEDYRNLFSDLIKNKRTTGPNQTEALVNFTKLNNSRMKRWEKTYSPTTLFSELETDEPEIWLVITEAWCGDAAQIIPVLYRISQELPHIDFRLVLRDENLDLMDMFLTNGSRSVPKLIRLKQSDLSVINTWGPRPEGAQPLLVEYKANPEITADMFKENLARWYVNDGGKSIEEDILTLLNVAVLDF